MESSTRISITVFNPLLSPACLATPKYLSGVSAWVRHIPFAFALVDALRPRVLVELGTHYGDSYCSFCQAVTTLGTQTRCYAVDSWKDNPPYCGADVLKTLRANHDPHYSQFSTLIQSEFDSARSRFADGTVDLLHIDGLHTYEAVKYDFDTWLSAVSDRGVILFHDTRVRDQGFGVWRLWDEIRGGYDHFELQHGYGLGVLAVGRHMPEAFQSLMTAAHTATGSFDQLFDTLGVRMDLWVRVSRQQSDIAQLEKQRVIAESRG